MRRPSIDMRRFARSKNRRSGAHRNTVVLPNPRCSRDNRQIDATQSALSTLSAFCLEGDPPHVAALVAPPRRPLLADRHTPM
jgi:hypothetical protein